MKRFLDQGVVRLAIDVSALSWFGDMFDGVVIKYMDAAEARGGGVVLFALRKPLRDLMDVLGLLDVIPVADDLADAVAFLTGQCRPKSRRRPPPLSAETRDDEPRSPWPRAAHLGVEYEIIPGPPPVASLRFRGAVGPGDLVTVDEAMRFLDQGVLRLAIDLAGGSPGTDLGLCLVRLRELTEWAGARVVLSGVSKPIRDLLHVHGLIDVFLAVETHEDAIQLARQLPGADPTPG